MCGALLALVVWAIPASASGQAATGAPRLEADDTLALRVRYRLLGTTIVRGPADAQVARIGFGTPPLRDLFAGSEEAAASFERFSKEHARSSWTGLLGGIGFVGGMVAGARGEERWAAALSIGGTVFSMGSGVFRTRANEHLSKAIWWYNASLAGPRPSLQPHRPPGG